MFDDVILDEPGLDWFVMLNHHGMHWSQYKLFVLKKVICDLRACL